VEEGGWKNLYRRKREPGSYVRSIKRNAVLRGQPHHLVKKIKKGGNG